MKLVQAHPEFRDLYADIAVFRKNTEELITMASEALTIADNNAVKMMYDEMQEEIAEMQHTIADMDKTIADMQQENEKLIAEIQRLKSSQ